MMDKQSFYALYGTVAHNNWDGHGKETYGWWAQQNDQELWWIVEKLSQIKPKKVVEIGSAHGGTLFFWDKVVGPGGKTLSVDMWEHHGITLDFSNADSDVLMLKGNSHDTSTFEKVSDLTEGSIDFLFIDGDHSYEGAKYDYELYSPLVRSGGLVAFHDVAYDTEIQVRRFFLEIDEPKDTIELTHGIGVVYK